MSEVVRFLYDPNAKTFSVTSNGDEVGGLIIVATFGTNGVFYGAARLPKNGYKWESKSCIDISSSINCFGQTLTQLIEGDWERWLAFYCEKGRIWSIRFSIRNEEGFTLSSTYNMEFVDEHGKVCNVFAGDFEGGFVGYLKMILNDYNNNRFKDGR